MDRIDHTPAPAEAVLRFQQTRLVKSLYIEFLLILQEIGHEHDEAMAKLEKALPKEYQSYVELADYLLPEKGQRLRKRVLDRGNDILRELETLVNTLHIELK